MQSIDIRKPLKKYLPYLLKAKEDHLTEGDTVVRLIKIFEEVLGYNSMTDITREQQIKAKYVDIAIKLDGRIRLLVEAKAAGNNLRDRYIEQAEMYASEGNIQWVLLTNGVEWSLYHLHFEEGIEYDRAYHFDLSTDPFDKCCELLSLLHKKCVLANALETFWEHRKALNPLSVGNAMFSEEVITLIRREIWKNGGVKTDEEDLALAMHTMLTVETRELLGPVRIRRKKKARIVKPKASKDIAAGGDIPTIEAIEIIESESEESIE